MTTIIKLATTAAAAALLSTPVLAQEVWSDEDWDMNGDGVFGMEEFREGFRERINFAEWDADADGLLTEEEFGGAIFSRYDADVTDGIEEAEFGALDFGALDEDFGEGALWRYQGDELVEAPGEEAVDEEGLAEADEGLVEEEVGLGEEVAELEAWDIDGDGVMLRNEFEEGFCEWGTFGEFDADMDGGITKDELTEGIFTRYDDDGSGFIEEPELTDIGDEGFWDA